ncbi:uncharacterized protein [Henckelia pumila]|uniref:uncharacterized protein isoform X2 n=1 Tax=Henckelia pumila TaxID=405737 RepID=UPI003C6DEBEA
MSPIRSGIRWILSGNKLGARKYSTVGAAPDQRVCEQKSRSLLEHFAIGFNIGLLGTTAYEMICIYVPGATAYMPGASFYMPGAMSFTSDIPTDFLRKKASVLLFALRSMN